MSNVKILQNIRTYVSYDIIIDGSSSAFTKCIVTFEPRKQTTIAESWNYEKMTTCHQTLTKMVNPTRQFAITKTMNTNNHCCCKTIGSSSPISELCDEISWFFELVGFVIVNTPEIETERNNFTVLNTPAQHPSRSDNDTFYLNLWDPNGNALLLRTHLTASHQHFFDNNTPPFKLLNIGKVYRQDDDNSHLPMFHQVEGLWIDRNLNVSHLKGLYLMLLNTLFKNMPLYSRFRTSYFPFTEPSIELDIKTITDADWLEVSGGGSVHPTVLVNFGINDKKLRGIAFGIGIERLLMVKNRTTNIRSLTVCTLGSNNE